MGVSLALVLQFIGLHASWPHRVDRGSAWLCCCSCFILFKLTIDEDAVAPNLDKDLLVRARHLSLAMLLVLAPSSNVRRPILRCLVSLTITHIIPPLTFVSVLFACEKFALSMAFVGLPRPYVQVLIIVVTVALSFSQVVLPIAMVLIISPLVLIRAVEDAVAVANVAPLGENVAFIVITIAICVSSLDPTTMIFTAAAIVSIHVEVVCCHSSC